MTHQNLSGPIKTRQNMSERVKTRQNMSERVKTRQNATERSRAQIKSILTQLLAVLMHFSSVWAYLATICLHCSHISHYLLISGLIVILFKLNYINLETELHFDIFFFTSECIKMLQNASENVKNASGLNFALFWPNFDNSYASRLSFRQFLSNLAVFSLILGTFTVL